MKSLIEFILFILLFLIIICWVSDIKIHTINEPNVKMSFKDNEIVYILPDSTKGMIEDGFIITGKVKNKITNRKEIKTLATSYNIIYTDKNGVIQRLKWVDSDILIKR